MNLNFRTLLTVTVLTLATQAALAGGAGLPPKYKQRAMIHCRAIDANEKVARELTYITNVQDGFSFEQGETNILIKGDLFTALILGENDLPVVAYPTDQPVAFHPQNGVLALMWNVRAIRIEVRGDRLSLSMIAGALGQNKVNNVQMSCVAANN